MNGAGSFGIPPLPDAVASEEPDMPNAIFIVLQRHVRANDGTTKEPGDLLPEAADWRRLDVSLDRRELLRLSPEACAAIVREAVAADPGLATEIVRAARADDARREAEGRRDNEKYRDHGREADSKKKPTAT